MDRLPVRSRTGSFSWLGWLPIVLVSGSGALAAVRLATPLSLDEPVMTLLLFFIGPALLIGLLGRWRRALGVGAAMLVPVAWALLAIAEGDGLRPWVPVAAGAALIALLAWHDRSGARERAGRWVSVRPTLGAAALACMALAWPGPRAPAAGTRLLLFGLDGGTWSLVDRLVAEGRLPHFAQALRGGQRARLRSLPVMLSPQIWTTMATGFPPETHGALDFACTQSQLKVGRLWDELREEQRSYGLCGWYFTWPPPPGLGNRDFVIPCQMSPAGDTWPADYAFFWRLWTGAKENDSGRAELVRAGLAAFRHGVPTSTLRGAAREVLAERFSRRSDFERDWRQRLLSLELEGHICAELLRTRRPEFAAVLFTQLDRICHKYWKFMEPSGFPELSAAEIARYGGIIGDTYALMDKHLGRLLDQVPDDCNLLVVSDHGFQAGLGKWAGSWCSIRSGPLLETLEVSERVFATTVDDLLILRPLAGSEAVADSLLHGLFRHLGAACLTNDASPLFTVERDSQALRVHLAPRNALPEGARITLAGRDFPLEELITMGTGSTWSGEHDPDGMFLLAGPAALRSAVPESLNVLDVAPTVAELLGLRRRPDWPGRAAVARPDGVEPAVAAFPLPPAAALESARPDKALVEKLRAIGYVR